MSLTFARIVDNPVFKELSPEGKEFLDVRWLPRQLNPFESYEIKVGAIVLKRFPHIKTVATVQMMLEDYKDGCYEGMHTIVVPSSGNTAHAVARLARAFGFSEVKVVLAADVPSSKKEVLSALSSADVIEVSGGKSVEDRARTIAEMPGHVLLDQYTHMGNLRAHQMYTGPEIARVLGCNAAVVAIAMGSGGTAAGVGFYFKSNHLGNGSGIRRVVVGVRPNSGERVPGARDRARMEEVVKLPWKEVVDTVVEIPRKTAFFRTRELWGAVEPQPGPSSGLAYGGLMKYLGGLGEDGLEALRGKTVGFLCPDHATLYSGLMNSELDTDEGLWAKEVHI